MTEKMAEVSSTASPTAMTPRIPFSSVRGAVRAVMLVAAVTVATPLMAQNRAKGPSAASPASPTLVGNWAGTATVPVGDSTIVVPVFYTFTQAGTAIGGTAMVPGQGSGPISNVVRDGTRVRFRVTAPEGKLLEHDGVMGAVGIEGMVNLDNLPIAKFKIAPSKTPPPVLPATKPAAKPPAKPPVR
jgi:hypothetical protein